MRKTVFPVSVAWWAAAVCVLCALPMMATPLDDLVPAPRTVVAAAGRIAEKDAFANLKAVTGSVAGAPADVADEAYVLEVKPEGTTITASSPLGQNWGRVTLEQLAKLSDGQIPCCRIVDWPQFRWRGFMHDSGRNFLDVIDVKAVIDAMRRAKMNLFHWHLTEYYGWRLESKKHPELMKDSSFYLRYVGKYYTQADFREIVDYAHARGVTVMPEFDVPGHALAFRRAFGFQTMRDDGVREILCDLVDELCTLAPADKMPFIHLGTDEARLPEEKVPPKWLEPLVDRVHAAGRTVVGWTPGELAGLTQKGPTVGMRWGRPKSAGEVGIIPFFDASGMYLDTLDPFELLGVATYRRMCPWDEAEGARLGAITCAWHDDFAGTGRRTLGNQTVFPALVLLGDAYWCGRDDQAPGVNGRLLPRAGDARLAKAAELERRVAVQRDKVWKDWPYPFQFLKQTDMRWRVSAADGTVVAKDVAQATLFFWQNACQGVEGVELKEEGRNLFTNRTGVAIAETWIKSPKDQRVGAWIGFTDYTRDHGRAYSAPTPGLGQWSRYDAQVELNGEKVPPPVWRKPAQRAGNDVDHLLYVHELDEIAFEDEEYYMREPTGIHLKKGWNHVKLTVPMKTRAANHQPWVATFIPLLGTTGHPQEVPGLEYRSEPPGDWVTVTVTTRFADGRVACRREALAKKDGKAIWRLPRQAWPTGTTEMTVAPDFGRARVGEEGYYVFADGARGFFRDREGVISRGANWQLMPVHAMKTPRTAFTAIVKGMTYHAASRVTAKKGEYAASFVFDRDMDDVYEDLAIEYRFCEGTDVDYSDLARAYRNYQLERGACRPLADRAKERPMLAYAATNVEVRIRQAWKPVPSPATNQVSRNEPPVKPVVPFDRVTQLARACQAAGVPGAEFCLVGWQHGGHDGAYPDLFPVEPSLGGEAKLKACVKDVQALGYAIVAHGNHRDCYMLADSWDAEYVNEKRPDGTLLPPATTWGAGGKYTLCAQRAYERFAIKDAATVATLGFRGLYYLDVTTCHPPYTCRDPRHPMTRARCAEWENAILDLQTKTFGGCSSEGGCDAYIGHFDSALTISWAKPFAPPRKMIDDYVPFWQLVYHGIVLSTPFRSTINTVVQDDARYTLKLVEFGGRPTLYVHSHFISGGRTNMGARDLRATTDAELAETVRGIKTASDEFARRADLEFAMMERHEQVAPGVFKTTYAGGAYTFVNYNEAAVEIGVHKVPAMDYIVVRP